MIEYGTLNVRIESLYDHRYRATVWGPNGDGRSEFELDFGDRELDALAAAVSRPRAARRRIESDESAYARQFGQQLFDLVFQGTARDALRTALARARQESAGLRLMLQLEGAPGMRNVPWELLWDSRFISTSAHTPVLRYVDISTRPPPLHLRPPLRIVGLVSSPSDMPRLDAEREREQLADACRPLTERGLLEIDWVQEATLSGLLDRLNRSAYHIFHFIGHGDFDEREDDGVLLFEAPAGRSHRVTGVELGTILADQYTLRLAVINACEGARVALDSNGVAADLMRYGLPAVVAMQFEISDEAAICFARHFYESLTRSHPLDEALADARRGMFAAGHGLEWATPVLFTSLEDGRLFEVDWQEGEPEPVPAESATAPVESATAPGTAAALDGERGERPAVGSEHAGPERDGGGRRRDDDGRGPRWRKLPPPALAGALAALGVVVAVVLLVLGGGSAGPRPQLGVAIKVGESPTGIAVGHTANNDRVWVTENGEGKIRALDPRHGNAAENRDVGKEPNSLAIDRFGVVWVANMGGKGAGGSISRIDPRDRALDQANIEAGSFNSIAVGEERVWATDRAGEGKVLRLNLRSPYEPEPIEVGREPSGIAVGDGSVWVANSGSNTLSRIDARTGSVLQPRIPVGERPVGVAVEHGGHGYVWVANKQEGTIEWLDPTDPEGSNGKVQAGRGCGPQGVAVEESGKGYVWVTESGCGKVGWIDPRHIGERPQGELEVPGSPTAVAVGLGKVWVTNVQEPGAHHRTVIPITP